MGDPTVPLHHLVHRTSLYLPLLQQELWPTPRVTCCNRHAGISFPQPPSSRLLCVTDLNSGHTPLKQYFLIRGCG